MLGSKYLVLNVYVLILLYVGKLRPKTCLIEDLSVLDIAQIDTSQDSPLW